ncbi:MAG: S8 family serine peptidase [Candidatus Rokuibacteriota bacterium]
MRKIAVSVALVGVMALLGLPAVQAVTEAGAARSYVVKYEAGVSLAQARAAVRAAGGTILRENVKVGVATVRSTNANFILDAAAQGALVGAARNIPIGSTKPDDVRLARERLERAGPVGASRPLEADVTSSETFSSLQWDMEMIDATEAGSYAVQKGDPRVIVASMDTGVDATHPDIAPNFDAALSRNFTVDIPLVDGPCEEEPDASCNDPADVDENGHGTHTSGTMAGAINGLGISGVAPEVTLINVRVGQDSGYFFIQPFVDGLTYAADIGVDVVNMSFFIDPWWMNCPSNPADSPEEQAEQQTIIAATTAALTYAHRHKVTIAASAGNEVTDLGAPTEDSISPDFPPGVAKTRTVDNSCVVLPSEGKFVITTSALGPSGRKAYYSNWGLPEIDVSAPGGDRREFFGTPQYNAPENRVLSSVPFDVAVGGGFVDAATCTSLDPLWVVDNSTGVCATYAWFQGTSMASPHVAGVAALIVSQFGHEDPTGGLSMNANEVQKVLEATATDTPCPEPRLFVYPDAPGVFDALCEGSPRFNGFYGHGIVNALAAVS